MRDERSDIGVMKENMASSLPVVQCPVAVRTNWRELGVHSYIKIIIIGGFLYYLFRNEIDSIVTLWVTNSSWSHGFLIPLFSLYFLNQHKNELLNLKSRANYLGLFFLVLVILFYFFNIFSPAGYTYFRRLSLIGALLGVVLFLGGGRLLKYTWLPILYLIFAIPLPDRYHFQLTYPMRVWAAEATTRMLNMIDGVNASLSGVIITVLHNGEFKTSLNVEDACSGMRLLLAFLALGVAMAYLHYRPIWQRIVLLLSTVPVAIFCNIVRVTVTGFIHVLWNEEYARGIYHDLLGLLMLPLAFGIYYFLAWFMSNLFVDETEKVTEDIVVRKHRGS